VVGYEQIEEDIARALVAEFVPSRANYDSSFLFSCQITPSERNVKPIWKITE
jgi:hypothetical protein